MRLHSKPFGLKTGLAWILAAERVAVVAQQRRTLHPPMSPLCLSAALYDISRSTPLYCLEVADDCRIVLRTYICNSSPLLIALQSDCITWYWERSNNARHQADLDLPQSLAGRLRPQANSDLPNFSLPATFKRCIAATNSDRVIKSTGTSRPLRVERSILFHSVGSRPSAPDLFPPDTTGLLGTRDSTTPLEALHMASKLQAMSDTPYGSFISSPSAERSSALSTASAESAASAASASSSTSAGLSIYVTSIVTSLVTIALSPATPPSTPTSTVASTVASVTPTPAASTNPSSTSHTGLIAGLTTGITFSPRCRRLPLPPIIPNPTRSPARNCALRAREAKPFQ